MTPLVAVALAATQVIAIRAGRIIDPPTGRVAVGQTILIEGGRIRAVGATVYDLSTLTVIPGLIDAHVHLVIGGTVRDNALADLRAGFTTVVDLGARTHRLLRLRDSINAGHIPGPRVLAAGIWVGRKDGVCEFNGIGIAGGPDAFRQRVRENIAAGADLIKVCVTGWPADAYANPGTYELPGVLLRDRSVFLIPTLASLTSGDSSAASRALTAAIGLAQRVGVRLVFGTDGGVLPHGQNAQEFLALRLAGVLALEQLRAATTNAAQALGLSDSLGRIAPGMLADIVAVDADPLADVEAFQRVRFVISRGRVVLSPP